MVQKQPSVEHPFAPFVRILGKGKQGSRSLSQSEAREAMQMILDGQVEPEQLGAFLMLLRVKEESPEELAGFVEAVRGRCDAPKQVQVDLDWSTYAGKKRQLPWFILVALLLAENGIRVFMHGAKGHTPGRIYTEDCLAMFGLRTCNSWDEVAASLDATQFAFMSIDVLSAPMSRIINLRPVLGLRSPVHTLCRLINPLHARYTVDGVFHPAYGPMHQKAAQLLGVENGLTIKGDGGEAEVKPDDDCDLQWTRAGDYSTAQWSRYFPRRLVKQPLEVSDLLSLWRGEIVHEYGEGAVISTLAVLLKLLQQADDEQRCFALAEQMWQGRSKARY
ncbi:glycosyl transferase family protein [Amphritea sp. 1_MG-2023]|uniref:glycosyl transferase family protein n=1 Tax=Amphritea sp. 1_MG-2023 TaxID=3062670 RepID=UPI0026E37D6A|nr:glycosyl transferase family protein [Amphritea sp. 1_MG-2023]MDO6562529.1 glycosyl transferase family protein [Amphritea sp. 1_MG-2023]